MLEMGGNPVIPDPKFVKRLRAYDADLRVVWSRKRECWLIERKIRRSRSWYGGLSLDPDVKRRYLDGYIHVGNVDPRMLDDRVLLNLWQNDMWRQGGAKTVNALLDEYHETKARREDQSQRDDLRGVAEDMWNYLSWRRKGRIAVQEQVA